MPFGLNHSDNVFANTRLTPISEAPSISFQNPLIPVAEVEDLACVIGRKAP